MLNCGKHRSLNGYKSYHKARTTEAIIQVPADCTKAFLLAFRIDSERALACGERSNVHAAKNETKMKLARNWIYHPVSRPLLEGWDNLVTYFALAAAPPPLCHIIIHIWKSKINLSFTRRQTVCGVWFSGYSCTCARDVRTVAGNSPSTATSNFRRVNRIAFVSNM
jgi:hypothetical protein